MTQTRVPHESYVIPESEIKYWKDEISAGERRRKAEFLDVCSYDKIIKYYEGKQGKLNNGADIVLDEISTGLNSILSTIISRKPGIATKANHKLAQGYVEPPMLYRILNPDFQPFLRTDLMQASIKWLIDQDYFDIVQVLRLCGFDLLTAGFCMAEANHATEPLKTANQTEEPGQPREQEPEAPSKGFFSDLMSDVGKFMRDPLGNTEKLSVEETEQEVMKKLEYNRDGFRDWTYCLRWDPRDIIFDSRAKLFNESRCITKIIRKSLAEFNFMYPNFKDKVPMSERLDLEYGIGKSYDDQKGVVLYQTEILYRNKINKVLITAKGIDKALDCYFDPVETNGFKLKYECLDDYGKIYPVSRALKCLSSQDSLNKLVTQESEHALRSSRKTAYFEGGLTPEGKLAMNSSNVYAQCPKNTPAPIFESVPYNPVSPDNKELQMKLTDNINKNIGSNDLVKSGDSNNPTLGQDMIQMQGFQANRGHIANKINTLASKLLNTAKDIIMQLWDGQDYFKVTGQKGGEFWYDPAMGPISDLVEGDYLIETDISEAGIDNMFRKRQEAGEMLDRLTNPMIVQFAMMNGRKVDIKPLEDYIKSFDKNPDTYLPPLQPINPMQQQITSPQGIATSPLAQPQQANAVTPIQSQGGVAPETNGIPQGVLA